VLRQQQNEVTSVSRHSVASSNPSWWVGGCHSTTSAQNDHYH